MFNMISAPYLLITSISKIWIISHCLGLVHEKMVCAATCLDMFLYSQNQMLGIYSHSSLQIFSTNNGVILRDFLMHYPKWHWLDQLGTLIRVSTQQPLAPFMPAPIYLRFLCVLLFCSAGSNGFARPIQTFPWNMQHFDTHGYVMYIFGCAGGNRIRVDITHYESVHLANVPALPFPESFGSICNMHNGSRMPCSVVP